MSTPAPRRVLPRLFAALSLSLGACAAPRSPLPDSDAALRQLQTVFAGDRVLPCLEQPLAAQRPCRDTIVQAMLVAIDLRYAEFEIDFFNANRGVGFGSSVAVLGLGAAGAVAATGASQILSAISGAVAGTREAFGRDLLADHTAAALLTTMRTGRNNVALRIREGLRREATEYPLGVALSDLYAYFRAGTLPGALAGLTEIVGAQARITQEELRRAVPVATGAGPQCLLGLISERTTPQAAVRAENRRRMRAAMGRAGLPPQLPEGEFAAGISLTPGVPPPTPAQLSAVARALDCLD